MRAAGVVLLLLVATGCGWSGDSGDSGDGGGGGDGKDGTTLTVLAASSLTDVFEELAAEFETEHEGVEVALALGSSTDLAEQAADGAPGDVLATADEAAMTIAEDAGATTAPAAFATNLLVIVTAPGNPAGITSLADLEEATWVRCAEEAPCGKVATEVLDAAGVDADPASLEDDARSTLDKVASGEADAGLVYASDAEAAGDRVETVPIPGAADHLTTYFVAPLSQTTDRGVAQAWVDLVTGDGGRAALAAAGFGAP